MKWLSDSDMKRKKDDISPQLLVPLLRVCIRCCMPYIEQFGWEKILGLIQYHSSSRWDSTLWNHWVRTTPRDILKMPDEVDISTRVCQLVGWGKEKSLHEWEEPKSIYEKFLLLSPGGGLLWWEADYHIKRYSQRQEPFMGMGEYRSDRYKQQIADRSEFSLLDDSQLLDIDIFHPGFLKGAIRSLYDKLQELASSKKTKGRRKDLAARIDALGFAWRGTEMSNPEDRNLALEIMGIICQSDRRKGG